MEFIEFLVIILPNVHRAQALNNLVITKCIRQLKPIIVVAENAQFLDIVKWLDERGIAITKCILLFADSSCPNIVQANRLWFNGPAERKNPSNDNGVNFYGIQTFDNKSHYLEFWPREMERPVVPIYRPQVVTISSVNQPSPMLKKLWPKGVPDDIFTLCRSPSFWDPFFRSDGRDYNLATTISTDINSFFRIKFASFLQSTFGERFCLSGSDWQALGFKVRPFHDRDQAARRNMYKGNVCVTFGSYAPAFNSMYATPIEIIESGGLPIIPRTPDSILMLNQSLLVKITYTSTDELRGLISSYLDNPDYLHYSIIELQEYIASKQIFYDSRFVSTLLINAKHQTLGIETSNMI